MPLKRPQDQSDPPGLSLAQDRRSSPMGLSFA